MSGFAIWDNKSYAQKEIYVLRLIVCTLEADYGQKLLVPRTHLVEPEARNCKRFGARERLRAWIPHSTKMVPFWLWSFN